MTHHSRNFILSLGLKLFLISLFFASAWAAGGSFTLEVSRNQLAVGESLQLTLRFNGIGQGNFTELKLPAGLRILGQSTSSSFRMINGESSSETALVYEVLAEQEGSVRLGPFETTVEGKNYKTDLVNLEVGPPLVSGLSRKKLPSAPADGSSADKKSSAQPSAATTTPDQITESEPLNELPFTVTATLSSSQVFVGEQVFLVIELENLEDSAHVQYRELNIPDMPSFQVDDIGKPQTLSQIKNGRRVSIARVIKRLTPLQSGDFNIDGIRAIGDVLTPSRRQRGGGFFGNLMSDYDKETRAIQALPLELEVKALPVQGRPQNFSGLVGDSSWSISFPPEEGLPALKSGVAADVNPVKIKTGDSVTLTVSVASSGDLSGVSLPIPEFSGGAKIYADNPALRFEKRGEKMVQVKEFKFAMVFPQPGRVILSPLQLSYFSTTSQSFEVLEHRFRPLEVTGQAQSRETHTGPNGEQVAGAPESQIDSRLSGQDSSQEKVEQTGVDLFPIKSENIDFQNQAITESDYLRAVSFPGAMFSVLISVLAIMRFRERLPFLSRLMRKRGALSRALKELDVISTRVSGEGERAAEALRIVKEYLGRRAELSLMQKTNAELKEILGDVLPSEFWNLLSELEMQVYSSGSLQSGKISEVVGNLSIQLKIVDGKL